MSRSRELEGRSLVGGILLGALAWALLALQIASMLGAPTTLFSIAVATAIPAMLSVTLLIGAVCVYRYRLGDLALRISGWTVLGVVLFSLVVGGMVLAIQSRLEHGGSNSILLVNVAAGGAVLGFLIGLYDARQRRLLGTLREEYDRTVGLSQRLSVLARILRHDLRNQLTVIVGQADRLEEHLSSPEAVEAASAIQDAGEELVSISENIGQFSTILADPQPDQTVLLMDLTEVLHDAVDVVRDRYGSESVSIETAITENVVVEASPFLPKALVELLENAIIHNDESAPHIEIRVETDPAPDGWVDVRIIDNGPGISADEVEIHDSDIETQLDHSTGVGLWLVRWVVTASGGEIEFETDGFDGTTVRIRLTEADRGRMSDQLAG